MFEEDPETEAIILLGAIGGRLEHDEANFISHHMEEAGHRAHRGTHGARESPDGARRLYY